MRGGIYRCDPYMINVMSWIKSVACTEDVFDEDVDDISLQNKEWKYNMEKRAKDGYRDGIDAGKEASLQVAFNAGYREGTTKMKAIGQLKGIMSAVQCWCRAQLPESPSLASVTDLLQRLEKHEDRLVEAMRKAQERPPPSVAEMVDDMEDLNVDQRDRDEESGSCNKGADCCGKDGAIDCCGDVRDMNEDPSRTVLQDVFSETGDSFEKLSKCCLDLVTELGLPEELKCHIQQIIDV